MMMMMRIVVTTICDDDDDDEGENSDDRHCGVRHLWKLFPGSVIGHSQIPQVLKCTRSLQLHNTQVKRFSGIDICLLCLNAAQYNSAIENGKYDYTGVTVREFITGVEFQMQLNLGLHFDCFKWGGTILRSQRHSQDITHIGSSII